jgi:hypothetical protein
MTLPMRTFEDQVGTRVQLIDYHRMAYIIRKVVEDEPQQTQYLLQEWGEAIAKLGSGQPVHLKQPLKDIEA